MYKIHTVPSTWGNLYINDMANIMFSVTECCRINLTIRIFRDTSTLEDVGTMLPRKVGIRICTEAVELIHYNTE